MNMKTIIVDLQGFKNKRKDFIVKELAISTREHTHIFLIKPPYPYSSLEDEERKEVWWIEKNRGYRWSEGYIDYREFRRIIKPYLNNRKILVKGNEKIRWVRDLCDHSNITDISNLGIPNLKNLSEFYCNDKSIYNCFTHNNICALRNVLCIKKWCEKNNVNF